MDELSPLLTTFLTPAKDLILVADCDTAGRQAICLGLRENGFDVVEAKNYSELAIATENANVSLVIIEPDGMGGDGMEIVRFLCNQVGLPLVIVSNKGRAINKVIGLELGADDYMHKPIDVDELVARIRAVLRRTRRQRLAPRGHSARSSNFPLFRFDGWELDAARRTVTCPKGVLLDLTSTEIDLLLILVRNAQAPLSREMIIEQLGKRNDSSAGRTIDVLISKLRRKLEGEGDQMIKTVRGAGYVFTAAVAVT
jgi:two-component system, OmpR family, response regulator